MNLFVNLNISKLHVILSISQADYITGWTLDLQNILRPHILLACIELVQKKEIKILTWWNCAYIPYPKPFFLTSKGINKGQIRTTGRTEENSLGRRKQVSDFSISRKPQSKPLLLSTRTYLVTEPTHQYLF